MTVVTFDPGQGDLVLFVPQLGQEGINSEPVCLVGDVFTIAFLPARFLPAVHVLIDAFDHILGIREDGRLMQALI
ncbi:hypothetical protein D3C76_1728880 [compost metagenome]